MSRENVPSWQVSENERLAITLGELGIDVSGCYDFEDLCSALKNGVETRLEKENAELRKEIQDLTQTNHNNFKRIDALQSKIDPAVKALGFYADRKKINSFGTRSPSRDQGGEVKSEMHCHEEYIRQAANHTVCYHCPCETEEQLELFIKYIRDNWKLRTEQPEKFYEEK